MLGVGIRSCCKEKMSFSMDWKPPQPMPRTGCNDAWLQGFGNRQMWPMVFQKTGDGGSSASFHASKKDVNKPLKVAMEAMTRRVLKVSSELEMPATNKRVPSTM
ncbi:hypothetical protein NC652_019964 [Populus alba x Populus x berolinensis]|nr:hypothetical protein NC652_019964 [Populus alba x Populus x berolinensis]